MRKVLSRGDIYSWVHKILSKFILALTQLDTYFAIFFFLQVILRTLLLFSERGVITLSEVLPIFLIGLWYDIVAASFAILPICCIYLFCPLRIQQKSYWKYIEYSLRSLFTFILLFDFVAEYLFWIEFHARFNFIVVDYLIYTHEVIGNIIESYPIVGLLSLLFVVALLISGITAFLKIPRKFNPIFGYIGAIYCVVFLFFEGGITSKTLHKNILAKEISSNGMYTLFDAFFSEEINYDQFYIKQDAAKVLKNIRKFIDCKDCTFVNKGPDLDSQLNAGKIDPDSLTRIVHHEDKEFVKNVVIIVMESMGAEFMEIFGNQDKLTPNLDALAEESVVFMNAYATGTRTVRGLEAIALSIPPIPGQSLVRRPGNENLFSLGRLFSDKGYKSLFIYGGYSYFDNMDHFFSNNGFEVIDRSSMTSNEISFANIWGVADEDLFTRSIREADICHAKAQPFLQLIMTTSNHRPYSYPENRIDIPSKSGRAGGVKYADYSIGQFIDRSKKKGWFSNTVFILLADHTAGVAGKVDLDLPKYHIPILFYSPGFIKPECITQIISQIDVGPTLLGILRFNYRTKFFGKDALHNEVGRAFLSNYQKVGLLKKDSLTVLGPKKMVSEYRINGIQTVGPIDYEYGNAMYQLDPSSADLLKIPRTSVQKDLEDSLDETVAYYQVASWWRRVSH